MGEVYVWSEMDAGNWEAHRGKGKFDIETGWAQKVVERWGVKPRHWNEMKIHEVTCKQMLRDAGEIVGTRKWMPEQGGGNFWYWDKMHCKKVLRETGEHVDIEARWPQKIGEREAGGREESQISKQGWTQEVAETRSGSLDIEPKWRCMQEAVEREGEAEILKPHECGKLWRGTGGGDFRRPRWNQI